MNRAESALATAKRLAEVAAEEKRLTRELNATDCMGVPARSQYEFPMSHLDVFLTRNRAQYAGDGPGWAAVEEAEVAMLACPTCRVKWDALQARRAARRRRGALRAALVRIGKLALEEATP